jgi:hypothetical protein
VVRDENDFNQEDDDLLDEDDQAKDQDTEDMDESEPNRGNGQNSDEQPQPTDEFIGMTPTKQAALVEEAIDMACHRLIEELSYIVMNEPDDDVEIFKTMDPVQDELLALEISKDPSPTEVDSVVEAMVAGQQDFGASEGRYLSSDALAVAKAGVRNGSGASMGNSDAQLVVAAGHEQEPIAEGQQNLESGADDRGMQIVAVCAEATAAVQHHSQSFRGAAPEI